VCVVCVWGVFFFFFFFFCLEQVYYLVDNKNDLIEW